MSNSSLKLLAVLFMIIDHLGLMFFPEINILRAVGRLSFPIFAFLLVEGCNNTKNYKKYLLSLLLFAVISQIPFSLVFNNDSSNVMFTMFFGSFMILLIKYYKTKINSYNIIAGSIICLIISIISVFYKMDYCFTGIVLMYLIYEFKFIGCLIGCLLLDLLTPGFRCAFLALLPIYFYNKKRGLYIKYFFYIFYPLHLIIFYLIKVVFF